MRLRPRSSAPEMVPAWMTCAAPKDETENVHAKAVLSTANALCSGTGRPQSPERWTMSMIAYSCSEGV